MLSAESCFEKINRFLEIFISDVDECSQYETPCSANEECLNDQGTYSCVCRLGYKKKNKVCVRKCERLMELSTLENFHSCLFSDLAFEWQPGDLVTSLL